MVMFLIFVVFFSACVENGKPGLTALTSLSEEEAGENCADGEKKIESGLDTDKSGSQVFTAFLSLSVTDVRLR